MAQRIAPFICSIFLLKLAWAFGNVNICNSTADQSGCRQPSDGTKVPIGETLNVFNSFGFLASSIKIAPTFQRNNGDDPLFEVVTHPVLDQQKIRTNVKLISR